MSVSAFAYDKFEWLGRIILKIDKKLSRRLASANLRIHPEVYASTVGFFIFLSFIISLVLTISMYQVFGLMSLAILIIPFLLYPLLSIYPSIIISNRASGLEAEIPYAAAYISVMAAGGISPYKALDRLTDVKIMPRMAEAAKEIKMKVEAFGMDPVSAITEVASNLPSKTLKDLLLGYASTLNVGGDIVHYLQRKTFTIFEERIKQIKAIADRITMVMEAYVIFTVLLALGIYIIFIVSKLYPIGGTLFTVGSFVLFSYFILPFMTGVFIFIIDVLSPKYPLSDWVPYKVFFATVPVVLVLFYFTVVPYYIPIDSPLKGLIDFLSYEVFNAAKGLEPSIAVAILLFIVFLPGAVVHFKRSRETSGMSREIVNFLRDLVEARKTGLSPERCIETLAERDYGAFSKKLRKIANKLRWGVPLSKILHDEIKESRNWFITTNLFLLIDSIDVGGGTPEALEALASFGEEILLLEEEKKKSVKPLLMIPYLGGLITLFTASVFLAYVQNLAGLAKFAFNYASFAKLFLPPIVLNTVLAGLVAGKTSGEKVSAGFLHSAILAILTLVVLALQPFFVKMLMIGV